jgi:hypothetical protein
LKLLPGGEFSIAMEAMAQKKFDDYPLKQKHTAMFNVRLPEGRFSDPFVNHHFFHHLMFICCFFMFKMCHGQKMICILILILLPSHHQCGFT